MVNTQNTLQSYKPTILFATEGTYPYIMGGVSSWSDQLINGLDDFDFRVMTIVGPYPIEPAIDIPEHVVELIPVHFWRPRRGVRKAKKQTQRDFYEVMQKFLDFAKQDIRLFARSILALAQMGHKYDLWSLFETRHMWEAVRYSLTELTNDIPRLGEVSLTINWLRAILVPLLFVPPRTDIVHVVTNGLCVIPAYVAARAHKVPLLLTEHGIYLRERYLGFKKENDPYNLKVFKARFYKFLTQLMYVYSNRVTSVSNFNRYWQLELGAPEKRVAVIPNGIDPKDFSLPQVTQQDKPTIVWIGRVDPLKDLETLLKAFIIVKSKMSEAQLRLFGPVPKGNEKYHQKLVDIIEEYNLAPNATFEGPIKPAFQAYHAADIVVLSSISEGFPYTIIEAMMCGKPVVSTRAGGVGDAIDPNVGRLVPPQSPKPLAEALLELLTNKALGQKLGKQARTKALEQFTLKQMCFRYQELYLKVLEEPLIRLLEQKNTRATTFIDEVGKLRQLPLEIFFQLDNVLDTANRNNLLGLQKNENILIMKNNFLTEDTSIIESLTNIKSVLVKGKNNAGL